MGLVYVALWVPGVCRSSALIYNSNKGVWGLIKVCLSFFYVEIFCSMVTIPIQIALAVYAVNQVGIASFSEGTTMLIHLL